MRRWWGLFVLDEHPHQNLVYTCFGSPWNMYGIPYYQASIHNESFRINRRYSVPFIWKIESFQYKDVNKRAKIHLFDDLTNDMWIKL